MKLKLIENLLKITTILLMSTFTENSLATSRHVFVCRTSLLPKLNSALARELEAIKANFCGTVYIEENSDYPLPSEDDHGVLFLCGDIGAQIVKTKQAVSVIKELSCNYSESGHSDYVLISIDEVPINVHGLGVYYKQLFFEECERNLFNEIKNSHDFQDLTESNKQGKAYRTGIYLTNVEKCSDGLSFNLLRCSTNLSGPTDNFRDVDRSVVDRVECEANSVFTMPVHLNHVLAQIYHNSLIETTTDTHVQSRSEKKAVIKAHSDKTKDMPKSGIIAFTTFYDNIDKYGTGAGAGTRRRESSDDLFNVCYKGISVLTSLHFRLKSSVTDPAFVKQFTITLYPNSVFLISLLTNRLYTHEIRASVLPVDKIPTRLGYVIRCSSTKAVFRDGTHIDQGDGTLAPMHFITPEETSALKELYFKENTSIDVINYDSRNMLFSMNSGDYKMPIL